MKYKICIFFVILLCSYINPSLNIDGRYRRVNGKELLILKNNKTFLYLRNNSQKSDVIVPHCDTLAKGSWNQRKGFVELHNDRDFNRINFSISESHIPSNDSVYFKVILPKDDALDYRNFKFLIIRSPSYEQFEGVGKSDFSITNKSWGSSFGFVVQNLAPNCSYGKKSYQRVYFNVFEEYKLQNNRSNFFTIYLKNFSQCFYEAMDVDGEIIGIDNGNLIWKGDVFKKEN